MRRGAGMGANFKRLREEKGLSQSELSRLSGIPLNTIQQWEQDRREPSLSGAVRLADGLGVPLDVLAGREPPAPSGRKPRRKKGE
jgi:transcriptional regulator with XRE-family HTH domain